MTARAVVEMAIRPRVTEPMVYGVRVLEGAFSVGDTVLGPDGDLAQITEIREERQFPGGVRAVFHLSPAIALTESDEVRTV